jgi:hypothetical protein
MANGRTVSLVRIPKSRDLLPVRRNDKGKTSWSDQFLHQFHPDDGKIEQQQSTANDSRQQMLRFDDDNTSHGKLTCQE